MSLFLVLCLSHRFLMKFLIIKNPMRHFLFMLDLCEILLIKKNLCEILCEFCRSWIFFFVMFRSEAAHKMHFSDIVYVKVKGKMF